MAALQGAEHNRTNPQGYQAPSFREGCLMGPMCADPAARHLWTAAENILQFIPGPGALSSDSTLSRWAPSTRHVAAFPSLAAGFIASSRAVFRRAVDSRDQARRLPGDRPRADCWWR